jgi:hypothetical protein
MRPRGGGGVGVAWQHHRSGISEERSSPGMAIEKYTFYIAVGNGLMKTSGEYANLAPFRNPGLLLRETLKQNG